jgi:hypothetical protein
MASHAEGIRFDVGNGRELAEHRERVGIRDTGKFNYHLTKLCEYFVRQTESGYELGHAGTRVITAATPMAEDEFDVSEEDNSCPLCGEQDCEKLFHVHLTPGRF